MYWLSMKPQYENWCNCCVVSLFSPWVTHGPSLSIFFNLFFHSVILFFPFSSFLPSPLFHAHLLSVSLFAVSPSRIPCSPSLFCSPCCLSLPPSLPPCLSLSLSHLPLLYSLYPLAATEAWFTCTAGWREGYLSATSSGHMATCRGWQQEWRTCSLCSPPTQGMRVCLELAVRGREEKSLCVCLSMRKFLRVCFPNQFLCIIFTCIEF